MQKQVLQKLIKQEKQRQRCEGVTIPCSAHISYQVRSVPVREGAHVHISWDGLNIGWCKLLSRWRALFSAEGPVTWN